ncbi:MAG TPA: GNAT family protein [Thermoanaerobaculia bacterium]|jgi:RimJ/RimL family protein N-acetyltransferase|nr:GNAT family protein [Thermoanaerobaculia bacterium]
MISLRRFRLDDAESLVEAVHESVEQIRPWMPWCHPRYSIDDARTFIASAEGGWDSKAAFEMAIVRTDDTGERVLGACGLNAIRPGGRIANLGFWVRTSATGAGVATEAVGQLARFAFAETRLVRLEIVVAVGNRASARVAEKVGALPEGVAHDRLHFHGRNLDAWMFALLRSRFNG